MNTWFDGLAVVCFTRHGGDDVTQGKRRPCSAAANGLVDCRPSPVKHLGTSGVDDLSKQAAMLNSQLFKRKVVPRVPDQGRGRSKSKTKSKISNQRTPSVTIAGDIAVATSIDGLHDDHRDLPGASDAEGNAPAIDDARGGYSDEITRNLRQGSKSASGVSDSPPSSPPRDMELRHKDSLR